MNEYGESEVIKKTLEPELEMAIGLKDGRVLVCDPESFAKRE